MTLRLTSPLLADGDKLPKPLTVDGGGHPPPLTWDGAPPEARSFALVLHDPDAPEGDFTHWLVWDIPVTCRALPAGPPEAQVGTPGRNSFGQTDYHAAAPPPGDGPHRYYFELHALATPHLGLPRGTERKQFDEAIKPHLLETARLMLLCARPPASGRR